MIDNEKCEFGYKNCQGKKTLIHNDSCRLYRLLNAYEDLGYVVTNLEQRNSNLKKHIRDAVFFLKECQSRDEISIKAKEFIVKIEKEGV
jgi:hypothetical protein